MIRTIIFAALIVGVISDSAQARGHHAHPTPKRDSFVWNWSAPGFWQPRADIQIVHRPDRARRAARHEFRPTHAPISRRAMLYAPTRDVDPAPARAAGGLVPELAAKVAQIVEMCGSRLVSGVRHTFIAGTHRISLHAFGRAADVAGNPSCIYSMLHGWPGGYSTDYGRVAHVHISYLPGGREWGARFVHGGGHRHWAHHRKRHHLRFAASLAS